jgi:hypothetical protein
MKNLTAGQLLHTGFTRNAVVYWWWTNLIVTSKSFEGKMPGDEPQATEVFDDDNGVEKILESVLCT